MKLPIVTIQKLAEASGYTVHALRSKIARGEFAEGNHYIKAPDGRIHFIVEAYLRWVESNLTGKAFRSLSTGKGKDIDQLSQSQQPPKT